MNPCPAVAWITGGWAGRDASLRSVKDPESAERRTMLFERRKPDYESAIKGELPTLYRVARRLARSEDDAEELVQQTMVKSFQAWNRFDGRHLRSWLLTIMRNEHYHRHAAQKRNVDLDAVDPNLLQEKPFWGEVAARTDYDRIREEMLNLPEEYRLAVHLVDVEEMAYDEAAKVLDVPIGTIRSRVFRGRNLLRSRLAGLLSANEGGEL